MKKYLLGSLIAVAALGTLALQSCNRDKWEQTDSDVAGDNSLTEATENDLFKQSDEAATVGTVSFKDNDGQSVNGPCATVTHDSASNPRKVTIDFGTSNCVGQDSKSRRGKIIVTYTGRYRDAGTVITITTQDYFVNDNKVELTKTITNNGVNASGQPSWSIEVKNGKITLANNGGEVTWNTNRTRLMTAGYNTPKILIDDKYEISGSGGGVNAKGISYTVAITTPINVDFSCLQSRMVKGVIEFTRTGKAARILDFGNGSCDDQATITVGKTTKTITLKR
jgi:hypothetical protein